MCQVTDVILIKRNKPVSLRTIERSLCLQLDGYLATWTLKTIGLFVVSGIGFLLEDHPKTSWKTYIN